MTHTGLGLLDGRGLVEFFASRLKGLKDLVVLVDLIEPRSLRFRDEKVNRLWTQDILYFRKVQLESAKVGVFVHQWVSLRENFPRSEVTRWEKTVERLLMLPWKPTTKKKQVKKRPTKEERGSEREQKRAGRRLRKLKN